MVRKTSKPFMRLPKNTGTIIATVLINAPVTFGIVRYQAQIDSDKILYEKKIAIVKRLTQLDGMTPVIDTYWDRYLIDKQLCDETDTKKVSIKDRQTACERYLIYSEKLGSYNSDMESELGSLRFYAGDEIKRDIEDYMSVSSPFWKKDRDKLGNIIAKFQKTLQE